MDPFLVNNFGSQTLPSRNKTLRDTSSKLLYLCYGLAVVYCYFQVDFVRRWEPTEMHNDASSIRSRRSTQAHQEMLFRERRTMVGNFVMSSYYHA